MDPGFAFIWFLCATVVLIIGLDDTRRQAAPLRQKLESAWTGDGSENAQQLAGQLTREIRHTLSMWIGISLLLAVVGIGFLVDLAVARYLFFTGLAILGVLFLILVLVSLIIIFLWSPIRDLVRDLHFGRAIQRETGAK
jgi:hypothetical protein